MASDEAAHQAVRLNGSSTRRAGSATAGKKTGAHTGSEEVSFDETLSQLDETVAALESGQLKLDEALALFEHGMRLAQLCQHVLDHAELRVRQLVVTDAEASELTFETLEIDVE
jgi:exodeoxyribonuclease VII small subunit